MMRDADSLRGGSQRRRCAVLAGAGTFLVLNFGWEIAHARWFEFSPTLPVPLFLLVCALGDLALGMVAYGMTALLSGRLAWPFGTKWKAPAAIFVGIGLLVTTLVELIALRQGRWAYNPTMPTIGGIGITPLLQWSIIPPLTVALLRLVGRE